MPARGKSRGSQHQLLEDLKQLLLEGKARTQEEICDTLLRSHPTLNQSKMSRLLRKLGAIKTKNTQGEVVYQLTREPLPPSASTQVQSLIIDIKANENTIVIFTSPGSASLIARLLDYQQTNSHILATLAGDDTVFVLPKSTESLEAALNEVKSALMS